MTNTTPNLLARNLSQHLRRGARSFRRQLPWRWRSVRVYEGNALRVASICFPDALLITKHLFTLYMRLRRDVGPSLEEVLIVRFLRRRRLLIVMQVLVIDEAPTVIFLLPAALIASWTMMRTGFQVITSVATVRAVSCGIYVRRNSSSPWVGSPKLQFVLFTNHPASLTACLTHFPYPI